MFLRIAELKQQLSEAQRVTFDVRVLEQMNELTKQRDELLSLLKDAVDHIKAISGLDLSCDPKEDTSEYEAAIAKVKP